MILLGAAVNGITTIIAGILGSLCKKAIPERMSETVLKAIGLGVIYIGIDGCIADGKKIKYAAIVAIISLALGTVIGELIDFDKWLTRLGSAVQARFAGKGEGSFADGFVSASLLICVGAWAITGSMESGLNNAHASLCTKSVVDFLSCFIMAGAMGIGVAGAGVLVFLYEGALTLAAALLGGLLTEPLIAAMGCVGSILIIGVGLTLLGYKMRVVNCVPAVLVAIPVQLICAALL